MNKIFDSLSAYFYYRFFLLKSCLISKKNINFVNLVITNISHFGKKLQIHFLFNKCLTKYVKLFFTFMKKLFLLSMETTIGQKIKEVFESKKMRMNEFADKIDTVRQNVYKIFQRDSIDTELLVKISEILDHNFFQYFHPKTSDTVPANLSKSQSADYQEVIKKLNETEQELALAHKEIDYLKKIIDLMEERALLITSKQRA